jgi:signal transduction histidine kinase
MRRTQFLHFDSVLFIPALIALTGFSAVGLWAHRQARQGHLQEAIQRYQLESESLARRTQSALARGQSNADALHDAIAQAQTRRLHLAVGLYDPTGTLRLIRTTPGDERLASSLPQTSPANRDAEKSGFVGAWFFARAAVTDDGASLRLVIARNDGALGDAVARVVYEIPMWIGGALLLFWLGKRGVSALRPAANGAATLQTDGGELRFVMENYQHVVDRLQSEGRELQRQSAAARRRAESSERFSDRLIAGIPNALIVVASDGGVVVANAQARTLFHAEGGVSYAAFFNGAPDIAAMIDRALKTGETQRKSDLTATIGARRRVLEASVSRIPVAAEESDAVLCLVTDTTELADLRADLRLKETLAGLGEMAAGIAHEFKNSLATISGYARLLEQESGGSQSARALRKETAHLAQVVTDFLAFAKPQTFSFKPLDLRELLAECCDDLNAEAHKRRATLSLSGHFAHVLGDPTLLRRAFLNLIQNALESIAADAPHRDVRIVGDVSDACRVAVSDTGGGIAAEDLSNIFIPFFTTKSRGYGIGLAIVQKVIAGHNGRIEVRSSVGDGTTFTCVLPIAQTPSAR